MVIVPLVLLGCDKAQKTPPVEDAAEVKDPVSLSGPDDVVLGQEFTINVNTVDGNHTGTITIVSGTAYFPAYRTEKYWDAEDEEYTTPAYKHEFGIELPDPAQVQITSGAGTFAVTQFTLEPFTIKVSVPGRNDTTVQWTDEHVWCLVKSTYLADASRKGDEEGHENEPGYWNPNTACGALPYGYPHLLNYWIVGKKALADDEIEIKIRDRGPHFPFEYHEVLRPDARYPAQGDDCWSCYNDYWGAGEDDAGWKPLAEFMNGLLRAGDGTNINGAGLDLTKKAIQDLGFNWNADWSGNVYWRLK